MNTIRLICGLPGSGKDWFVKEHFVDSPILSFYKIRVQEYEKNFPDHGLNPIELYNAAWEYCNLAKIDLMKILMNEVELSWALGLIPSVCNTLLTRKSRASLLNSLKSKFREFKIDCFYLIVDSETIRNRNATRTSHRLSEEVLTRFINGPQELPLVEEGFTAVRIFHNG